MKIINKAADISARKMVFYIIFGFLAAATFLIIVFLLPSKGSEIGTIPQGLEDYLAFNRFTDSPDCFAFQDSDTKITQQGIIDAKKFNQKNLDKCYNEKDSSLKAYRITLEYQDKKQTIATMNWEGFLSSSKTFDVTINDNGEIKRGKLALDVQNA